MPGSPQQLALSSCGADIPAGRTREPSVCANVRFDALCSMIRVR